MYRIYIIFADTLLKFVYSRRSWRLIFADNLFAHECDVDFSFAE